MEYEEEEEEEINTLAMLLRPNLTLSNKVKVILVTN